MQTQHFRQPRTYTLRASVKSLIHAIRGNMPYKLQVVGLAYESDNTSELDDEWFMINENPYVLYSRRFVEQNYEEE